MSSEEVPVSWYSGRFVAMKLMNELMNAFLKAK